MSSELASKKCQARSGDMPAMTEDEAKKYLDKVQGWELIDEAKKIKKDYKFEDFNESMQFVNKLAITAEKQQHHPNITIIYNKVKITLTTHAVGGLSENDFIMAAKIDNVMDGIVSASCKSLADCDEADEKKDD